MGWIEEVDRAGVILLDKALLGRIIASLQTMACQLYIVLKVIIKLRKNVQTCWSLGSNDFTQLMCISNHI